MRKIPVCCSLLMMFGLSGMMVGCSENTKVTIGVENTGKKSDKPADAEKPADVKPGEGPTAKAADAKMPSATKPKPKKGPSDSSTIGGGVEVPPAAGGVEEKPEPAGGNPDDAKK